MSPTRFSLLLMRELDYRAEVVERWNAHAKIRQDLFGFIDVLAIRSGRIVAVQATSYSNTRSRITKALNEPTLGEWLAAGGHFEVHGWETLKPRGVKLRVHCLDDGDDGGRVVRFDSQKLPDAATLIRDERDFVLDGGALRMPRAGVRRRDTEDASPPF